MEQPRMNISARVAYFSMEIGLNPLMPTYVGGLGVLAGDTIRSAADLDVPMVVVTLLHRRGYFYQRLDRKGWQSDSMLSDYLTANSIFVVVIGLLVSRESAALPFTVVIVLLSVIGILMSVQMAIVLGRFSAQNGFWNVEPSWPSGSIGNGGRIEPSVSPGSSAGSMACSCCGD